MTYLRKLFRLFRRAVATVDVGQGAPQSVTLKSRVAATIPTSNMRHVSYTPVALACVVVAVLTSVVWQMKMTGVVPWVGFAPPVVIGLAAVGLAIAMGRALERRQGFHVPWTFRRCVSTVALVVFSVSCTDVASPDPPPSSERNSSPLVLFAGMEVVHGSECLRDHGPALPYGELKERSPEAIGGLLSAATMGGPVVRRCVTVPADPNMAAEPVTVTFILVAIGTSLVAGLVVWALQAIFGGDSYRDFIDDCHAEGKATRLATAEWEVDGTTVTEKWLECFEPEW